ncbi:integrase, catalytic region, zinc finger, CCHC-type containing protein [Tanacetum coccineum]
MLLMQAQENGVVLDEERLLFIAGGQDITFDDDVNQVFEADQCDDFDSDVDEALTAQTMFMVNLSSTDLIYDEAGPSYDSEILSEVQDHDNYLDNVGEYHEVHEMQNDYVKNNAEQVVQSNVSSVPNDALMMIINDMHEQATQCISVNEQNKVVNESLTAEIARYKEQVKIYEKRARFELTEREQNIDEKLRIIITDLKTNHAPAVVHDSEDTLESAEITRKRMLEKMKSPLWFKNKIKIAPPERFGNNESQTSQDAPEFDSFFEINKMKEKLQGKNNTIRKLKEQISHMNERRSAADRILDFKTLDSQNIELTEHVTAFQEQNERFRVENEKVKQHYKELYDSIKITCAKTIEKTSSLLTENEKLKAQLKGKMKCVTMNTVKLKVLAPGIIETLREIVKEDRIEKPLDNALENACFYTKRSQELLEYVIGTCPKEFSKRDKKVATTPSHRNKQVTFRETCGTSNNNTQTHVDKQKVKKTNVSMIPSTGVNSSTEASGSKARSNTKNNWILPARSDNKKTVEDHPRNNKSNLKQENRVDSSISYKRTEPEHVSTSEIVITKRFSNTTQKPLTRYKRRNKKEKAISTGIPTMAETQTIDAFVVQIILWYLDSGCSKHMMRNRSRLKNFMKKFIGTVRFGNDHYGAIMGYGDYMIGNSVISRVYYVEGLRDNLFSVGQFCDSDLEVAFRKHSCYVRDVDGVELLKGNRGSNLYTISIEDMMKSSPIGLLSKASKNKSWLWHRRLNHLNFGTINDLARKDLVRGLPRLMLASNTESNKEVRSLGILGLGNLIK